MIYEGSIWERQDELFIVERVYDAVDGAGKPIMLVKHRCIDPMPNHSPLDKFLEFYRPYDVGTADD